MLYRYGAVHDMAFFALCLKDQAEQRMLALHMDTVLWTIGRSMYKDYPIEPFQQMMKPKQEDTRTGREIVEDLADKFRARIARRGGQN